MVMHTLPGPRGEVVVASTVAGGTALTTGISRILLPRASRILQLIPRNFSTAVVCRYNKLPWITVLKTADALATTPTDYSEEAQDGDVATDVTLSSLDTLANGDALYVGSHLPFGGLTVDVDAANGNVSVLTVEYWNGSAWVTTGATDGTTSGGATMAVDGNITWTTPTAWATGKLAEMVATANRNIGVYKRELYWVRLVVSAALDASTTLNSLVARHRNDAYGELIANQVIEEAIRTGPNGFIGINAVTDAGTANLIANVAVGTKGRI